MKIPTPNSSGGHWKRVWGIREDCLGVVPRVFLSHAVVDEAMLMPAVDYLRRISQHSSVGSIGSGAT